MVERANSWILGRRFDLAFFFGASVLAAAAGVLVLAVPSLVVPAWWAFTVLVDGPHLAATWTRTYMDADERRRRRALLTWSPLLLLLGPGMLAVTKLSSSQMPWNAFLLLAALWSFHHIVRQHYGILSIYQRLGARPASATVIPPMWRRLDAQVVTWSLWGMFALFTFGNRWNRVALLLPPIPAPVERALLSVFGVVLALGLATYGVLALVRIRRGEARLPILFVLVSVVAVNLFSFFVVGAFEPLAPHPANPEQYFLGVTLIGGTVHGVQYLGIVFAANRRRYQASTTPSLASRLGRSALLCYAVLAMLSIGYIALNGGRGAHGLSFFAENSDASRIFIGIYWGLFFQHYYLDQKIWRPSKDPALRGELGIAQA